MQRRDKRSRSRSRSPKTKNKDLSGKKALTERKLLKVKRKEQSLPPVFLPNDPYAINLKKRNNEFKDKTRTKKPAKPTKSDKNEEPQFEDHLPRDQYLKKSDDNADDEITKQMKQLFFG